MAAPLAFRVAIALTLGGYKVVKWAQGAGPDNLTRVPDSIWNFIADPGTSDEDASIAVGAITGTVAEVATFNDPFELRKLQVLFQRTSADLGGEDDAVMTFHFLKLAGGNPSSAWDGSDFVSVEGNISNFWVDIAPFYTSDTVMREFRWYRTGPQRDAELGGPGRTGPPVRVTTLAIGGGITDGAQLPPQVAVSVTEQTASRKAWGRFYLPAPATSALNSTSIKGRLTAAFQTAVANAADILYDNLAAATPIVVYSTAKPERPQRVGPDLPAIDARALTVDQVQVDDLFDVIRSRRWNRPLLKLQRLVN